MPTLFAVCDYLKGDVLQPCLLKRGTYVLLRKPAFMRDDVVSIGGEIFMCRLPMNDI